MNCWVESRLIAKIDSLFPVHPTWPCLFAAIHLADPLKDFPSFESQKTLQSLLQEALASFQEKDLFCRLYDQVFVECLTHAKAIEAISMDALLEKILLEKGKGPAAVEQVKAFYERRIQEDPKEASHDLILYLAWDRVCVYFASLFDSVEMQGSFGLAVFKECLLESFQHIKAQGRTDPGFFRLIEALYAYEMREERLQMHTEKEWEVLGKGSGVLRPRHLLVEVPYVEASLAGAGRFAWTADSEEEVRNGLELVQRLIEKQREEGLVWTYEVHWVERLPLIS